jgi:hypothetical protein
MMNANSPVSSRVLKGPEQELSALPIWTVTLGVFALLTFGLTAVPSIICGHLALSRTRRSNCGSFEKAVTTVGLAIGYIGATVLGIWIAVLVANLVR